MVEHWTDHSNVKVLSKPTVDGNGGGQIVEKFTLVKIFVVLTHSYRLIFLNEIASSKDTSHEVRL